MTSKSHKKHADISRPIGGKFHRNEFAFLGAPCGVIEELCKNIAAHLTPFRVGYADASHGSSETQGPFHTKYLDNITHQQIALTDPNMEFSFRSKFQATDLVLINGNHFKGEQQIVIVNAAKKESLERKLDRLTNVKAIVLDEGMEAPFDFLKQAIPDFNSVPLVKISEMEQMAQIIKLAVEQRHPKMKGLVLAGGKSTRMGKDKGTINYHGKPQREFMADVLSQFCSETYISVGNQNDEFDTIYPIIPDVFLDMGPFGGILSAFKSDPNCAWLVVATDVPMVNETVIKQLVKERNASALATCFHNKTSGFPEPLITIWEPRAYPRLLEFMANGYNCPRKVLINSFVHQINPVEQEVLFNVNTPEELKSVKAKLTLD